MLGFKRLVDAFRRAVCPNDDCGNKAETTLHSTDVRIETPRMILREIDPVKDRERVKEIQSRKGFHYYMFDGTDESVDNFLKKCEDSRAINPETGERDYYMLAIELKDTGEFVGSVSLEHKSFTGIAHYETNFFVDPAFQNKAYGQEAIVGITHFAFEDLQLPYVNVTIEPDNKPSMAVAAHQGYREVGRVDIDLPFDGPTEHAILILDAVTFYDKRKDDRFPMLEAHQIPSWYNPPKP